MKVFFCDIDGTFQDLGQPIPEINKQAVREVQSSGNRFVFVTGRGIELVNELLVSEELSCDVIYGNGAGIKYRNQPEKLNHSLDPRKTKEMIRCLEKHHIYYFIHTTKGVYGPNPAKYEQEFSILEKKLVQDLGEMGQRIFDYKKNYFYNECQLLTDFDELFLIDHREIVKIEMMDGRDETLQAIVEDWQSFDSLIFQSYIQTLEVVHPKATKGVAIQEYMLSHETSISYGIGDGENDWPMFEAVDISVAVSNASPKIQEKCSLVIGSSSTGSVGRFILEELKK